MWQRSCQKRKKNREKGEEENTLFFARNVIDVKAKPVDDSPGFYPEPWHGRCRSDPEAQLNRVRHTDLSVGGLGGGCQGHLAKDPNGGHLDPPGHERPDRLITGPVMRRDDVYFIPFFLQPLDLKASGLEETKVGAQGEAG